MASGRLFEILYFLIEHKETTAKELAEHFEVSVRTIYRDLDKLLVAGIPIMTKQGNRGGVMLDQNYILDKTLLNNDEQEQILLALQSLSSLQLEEYEVLLQRMKTVFQKESQDWIAVDFSSWHQNKEMNEKFDLLKSSIFKHQIISFDYINAASEKSHKTVYPIKVFFKGNAWYLQAYLFNKKVYRTYRLSRMQHIIKHSETFNIHTLKNIPQVFQYQEKTSMIEVTLKFKKYLGSFVYDEFNFKDIVEEEDCYLVYTSVPHHEWFLSFLLSFGSGVEIIEPQEIRQQMKEELKKLINIYK